MEGQSLHWVYVGHHSITSLMSVFVKKIGRDTCPVKLHVQYVCFVRVGQKMNVGLILFSLGQMLFFIQIRVNWENISLWLLDVDDHYKNTQSC